MDCESGEPGPTSDPTSAGGELLGCGARSRGESGLLGLFGCEDAIDGSPASPTAGDPLETGSPSPRLGAAAAAALLGAAAAPLGFTGLERGFGWDTRSALTAASSVQAAQHRR
jgi:hypothetical protein